jgi:peptide/nickel transport system substrate-binding protein
VTAEDVAYTWATHVKYNTPTGAANMDYIEDIEAVDARRL